MVATSSGIVEDLVAAAFGAVGDTIIEHIPSARALDAKVRASDPASSLIVLDTELPDITSSDHLAQIVESLASYRSIAMMAEDAPDFLWRRLRQLGVSAAVPMSLDANALRRVIPLVMSGLQVMLTYPATGETSQTRINRLSDRERQVLGGICEGLQNKEIAHDFSIQEVTVKMHVRAIIRKLGAKNRTHAAMIARDLGMGL